MCKQSGQLISPDGTVIAVGYSGAPLAGKNNPAMQQVRDVGPIPCGKYSIGAPEYTVDHGPYVLRLTPDPANEMYGRAGFLIHGDSIVAPGNASKGCVIMPRFARERVFESGDLELEVSADGSKF